MLDFLYSVIDSKACWSVDGDGRDLVFDICVHPYMSQNPQCAVSSVRVRVIFSLPCQIGFASNQSLSR